MSEDRQRIDKWLWHARMSKTRTAAQRLVETGYVRLNGKRVENPSQSVKPLDVLTIALEDRVRVLKIRGFAPLSLALLVLAAGVLAVVFLPSIAKKREAVFVEED